MNTSHKPEDRENTYLMLYTKISKVTAEIEGKKQIYYGQVKELFSDVDVSSVTITRFLWAISHKTEVLPTILFSIRKTGNGVVIERLHSGFYDNSGKHIVGADLVPFIMRAIPLYQPKANKTRGANRTVATKQIVTSEECAENLAIEIATDLSDLMNVSDDALSYFGKDAQDRLDKAKADLDKYNNEVKRREEINQKRQRLQEVLELMEMNKDELKELLNI